jgi:hypothetical protein
VGIPARLVCSWLLWLWVPSGGRVEHGEDAVAETWHSCAMAQAIAIGHDVLGDLFPAMRD